VLFRKRFWDGIADGSVTLAFRRWRRSNVVAGRTRRTAGTIIEVLAVDEVDEDAISDAEARMAGYESADKLRSDLRGEPGVPVFRIRFRKAEGPDPRAELAAKSRLSRTAVAAIGERLERLDRSSRHGAWTMATLEIIGRRPAVLAADLAAELGRERDAFKLDVRKLKNLGLTESLPVGYRLSPRGRSYLRSTER